MKAYLLGTENKSTWSKEVSENLKVEHHFHSTKAMSAAEAERQTDLKKKCDFFLYVITPKMTGFDLIPDLVDDSNVLPHKTCFCYLQKDGESEFNDHQAKSLGTVGLMVEGNGARWFKKLDDAIDFLNHTPS